MFPDEQTRKQISNIIKTLLNVEVVTATEPSKQQYKFNVDLELSKNYALPIVEGGGCQEGQVNLIDRLVASIAGLDACVEVTAIADPNAVLSIQKFVFEKSVRKSSLSNVVFDPVIDIIGEVVGKSPNELPKRKGAQHKVDSWVSECLKNVQRKLASNLFTCKITIKTNSLQNAQTIKNALPTTTMNHFKTFKTHKKQQQSPVSILRKPSRYILRNSFFCNLWWAMPIGVLLFAGFLGLFNPLKFTSSILTLDAVFLVLAVCLAFGLFGVFRKRQPIVLSTQELSQIIGLPTATVKLPVALGKVPNARMQLGHEQTQKHNNKKPSTNNKEEEQNNNHLS